MAPKNSEPKLRISKDFAGLMALQRLDSPENTADQAEKIERFQSLSVPFPPGERETAFGGHVFAQSAFAASKTVDKGFLIHDVTGTFILPGRLNVPYVYTVRHLRDGKGYCTRAIDARQNGSICFSCLCSFKRDEEGATVSHQPTSALERYQHILAAKKPEEQTVSPSVDADWWIEIVRNGDITETEFPGLDMRKVDMQDYNDSPEIKQHPEKYRQLHLYSLKGRPEEQGVDINREEMRRREQSAEYDNLYACAHMYASDRNSLLLIPRALGRPNWTGMASLTIMVVFHEHGDALRMMDWDAAEPQGEVPKKWFVQEGWTPRSGENRAIHESWLWSPDGKLLATSYQDSMLRFTTEKPQGKL